MTQANTKITTAIFICISAMLSMPLFVNANSEVWNVHIPHNVRHPGIKSGKTWAVYPMEILKPNVAIEYRAFVQNATTGATIECGASVPQGTKLSFTFSPHKYQDVSWSTTGGVYDTPYGDWSEHAAPPEQISCEGNDFVGRDKGSYNADIYAPLRVHPPEKIVRGLEGLDCVSTANGSQECVMDTAGLYPVIFTFAPTMGKFYARTEEVTRKQYRGICRGDNTPLLQPKTKQTFILNVPETTITCPITIAPTAGKNPTTPRLSGNACVVDAPYQISVVANDDDGGTLTYLPYWNGSDETNGPSVTGTSGQTVSFPPRYLATEERQSLQVRARDEEGNVSELSLPFTFECAGEATASLITTPTEAAPPPPVIIPYFPPVLSLRATPSLLVSGARTRIHWSAENVTSCKLSGHGTNMTDNDAPFQSLPDGILSEPITEETLYTLSCLDTRNAEHTKTVRVRPIPTFQER